MVPYNYTLAQFTSLPANTSPSLRGLAQEIEATGVFFSNTYQGAISDGSSVTFLFDLVFTSAQQTAVDGVVANHDGTEPPEDDTEESFSNLSIVDVNEINGVAFDTFASSTNTHVADLANPHGTSILNLGGGTLAQLNSKVSDANLDSSTSPRPPTAHASNHSQGASDELIAQNLGSGAVSANQIMQTNGSGGWSLIATPVGVSDHGTLSGLGDDDHPQYLRTDGGRTATGNLNLGGNNLINVDLVDGIDVSTQAASTNAHIANQNNPHATSIANLAPGTLAQLNSKITNANLDASTDTRPPSEHGNTHESAGSDPLVLQNLSSGGAAEGQILLSDGSGGWNLAALEGLLELPSISIYNTSNSSTLSTAFSAISFQGENTKNDTYFTHTTNSPNITIERDGLYVVVGYATLDQVSSNNRTQASFRVTRNTGGGFTLLPGMLAETYHRQSAQGSTNGMVMQIFTLSQGDVLRLEAKRDSGSGSVQARSNACGLVIFSLQGLQGPAGPAGNGAEIQIQQSGAPLQNNAATLDFDANRFEVTENASTASIAMLPHEDLQDIQTNTVSLTSTSYITLQTVTIVKDGDYSIDWSGNTTVTTGQTVIYDIFINGTNVPGTERFFTQTLYVQSVQTVTLKYLANSLSVGDTVEVRWRVSGGTGQTFNRTLIAMER